MNGQQKPVRSSGDRGKGGGLRAHAVALADLLAYYNYRGGAKRCREQLIQVFQRYYPRTTIDDLVCEPAEALQFCKWARKELGVPLPDRHILRTLLNVRKRKALRDEPPQTESPVDSTPLFPAEPPLLNSSRAK